MKIGKGVLGVLALGICASLLAGAAPAVSAADTSSPLYGKTALFCGDSIGWGQWDDGKRLAFAGRIAEQYGMKVKNESVGGSSFTPVRSERIIDQIKPKRSKTAYDYVILQGGVNDAWGNVTTGETAPVGKVTDSFDVKQFNTKTYAGALEEFFYYTFQYYPNARVGYIYTFATPTSGLGRTGDMSEYYAAADAVCAKWGVQVLDLYHDRYVSNTMLEVKTAPNAYLKDALHPTAAGYDRLAPYIGAWMERMPDTKTYKENPYANKRVLFLGDSICAGYGDDQKREVLGWAGRMQDLIGICADNRAISGLSLSTIRSARVIDPMKTAPENAYDYVIMHGGINDAWGNNFKETPPAPAGKMTNSYSPVDFDISTVAGALEELFFNAYLRFPSARLGFIINFDLRSDKDMGLYDDVVRQICRKWNVACLDLQNDSYVTKTLLNNYSEVYLPDGAHPSAKGYDQLTPYIIKWFKTIPYADISAFESKMPVTDKVPKAEDTEAVEYCISKIGKVTAQNYREKRELIEEAEDQLDYYLVIYGKPCVIYIKNYAELRAARNAYEQFAKAGTTAGGKKNTTAGTKATTAAGTAGATVPQPTAAEDSAASSPAPTESGALPADTTTAAESSAAAKPADRTPWGWIGGGIAAVLAAAGAAVTVILRRRKTR